MKRTSQITKKLCKLATKLDELGMISEADRIDTISGLLAPGEAWSCPIDLKEDPMDSFFNFLDFIKEKRDSKKLSRENKPKKNPGDIVVDWLEEQHEETIQNLKSDLEEIQPLGEGMSSENVFYKDCLKLRLTKGAVEQVKDAFGDLPEDAKPLDEEDLCVILIEKKDLEAHKDNIKKLFDDNKFPNFTHPLSLETNIKSKKIGKNKKNWFLEVENQEEIQDYVNSVMEMLREDPEQDSNKFHVVIANLSGDPADC
tara:strand:- start:1469 stop:2236 length:768 start_codon:yes stop_codon:yes gene_type:complete